MIRKIASCVLVALVLSLCFPAYAQEALGLAAPLLKHEKRNTEGPHIGEPTFYDTGLKELVDGRSSDEFPYKGIAGSTKYELWIPDRSMRSYPQLEDLRNKGKGKVRDESEEAIQLHWQRVQFTLNGFHYFFAFEGNDGEQKLLDPSVLDVQGPTVKLSMKDIPPGNLYVGISNYDKAGENRGTFSRNGYVEDTPQRVVMIPFTKCEQDLATPSDVYYWHMAQASQDRFGRPDQVMGGLSYFQGFPKMPEWYKQLLREYSVEVASIASPLTKMEKDEMKGEVGDKGVPQEPSGSKDANGFSRPAIPGGEDPDDAAATGSKKPVDYRTKQEPEVNATKVAATSVCKSPPPDAPSVISLDGRRILSFSTNQPTEVTIDLGKGYMIGGTKSSRQTFYLVVGKDGEPNRSHSMNIDREYDINHVYSNLRVTIVQYDNGKKLPARVYDRDGREVK